MYFLPMRLVFFLGFFEVLNASYETGGLRATIEITLSRRRDFVSLVTRPSCNNTIYHYVYFVGIY